MKSPPAILLLFLSGPLILSCSKSKTGSSSNTQPGGSSYTQQMCGDHRFHLVAAGYNPKLQNYVADSSDTTSTINCNSSGSVTFSNGEYVYDSTSAGGVLCFHLNATVFNTGNIRFDHFADTIYIFESVHVSAASGQWSYTYRSF